MPNWYVHIQAAAETMESLRDGVPPGSPLSQQEAGDLFTAAHDHRNYLAAGALGPDMFYLLPDFQGDKGKGLLALVNVVLTTWQVLDDTFVQQWEKWMSPVLDDANQLADALSGGMAGEAAQVLNLVNAGVSDLAAGIALQMQDVFGLMSSGTQTGVEESAFFWADMFHYRKTYQFARQLYANALMADADLAHGGTSAVAKPAAEPSRVPKQQAFALGWMSHCAADVAGHPFTNAKCGGPYRTHWQRHHVVENHIDGLVYGMRHAPAENYGSLDTAALHLRLAFGKSGPAPDPAKPDDVPLFDYFPGSWGYPSYSEGESASDYADRKEKFDQDTEPLPQHLCELLLKTMQDVYTGPSDAAGPRVLAWDADPNGPPSGRPTTDVLQRMFDLAYRYAKFNTSSGLAPRKPMEPTLIGDHDLPRPPGSLADGTPDMDDARPLDILDILLAVVAFSLWLAELAIWVATVLAAAALDVATFPLREQLYQFLVAPAWDLYMMCRLPLVLEGFLSPKPSEVSAGLVRLGADEKGAIAQLRADLDAPSGVAADLGLAEPSGLDPRTRGAGAGGFGLDPAYPRAMVTDLDPPWFNGAPPDAPLTYSEFVAPWRYPAHNMAGMRNGWEAPRTHVGPYLQGDDAKSWMNGTMPGSDTARRRFEVATTPAETEAVSAELLPVAGENLGGLVEYGAYLIGQLTGSWLSPAQYQAHDWQQPLPDFNLDADRGYAYQCWDYTRHAASVPPAPVVPLDSDWPDQWLCAPQLWTFLTKLTGKTDDELTAMIRGMYGYHEPLNVPQRYGQQDNPHHSSRYDPLKHLVHHYLRQTGFVPPPPGWDGSDIQVGEAEIRDAGMSPTGRKVP